MEKEHSERRGWKDGKGNKEKGERKLHLRTDDPVLYFLGQQTCKPLNRSTEEDNKDCENVLISAGMDKAFKRFIPTCR